jgi:hypothetical protein
MNVLSMIRFGLCDMAILKTMLWNSPLGLDIGDEDIATLDTPTLWSSPSCNSSPTQLSRHPRIQQTHRHCFGHNSLIRHRNGTFLDALEMGRWRYRFGSGPSSRSPWIILCDHDKVLRHLFGPTWPCIMSGLKPKLWASNPWPSSTIGRVLDYKNSRRRC